MLYRFAWALLLIVTPALAEDAALQAAETRFIIYNMTLPGVSGLVHSASTIPNYLLPRNMPRNSYIKSTGNFSTPFDVFDPTGRKLGSLLAGATSTAPFIFRAAQR